MALFLGFNRVLALLFQRMPFLRWLKALEGLQRQLATLHAKTGRLQATKSVEGQQLKVHR